MDTEGERDSPQTDSEAENRPLFDSEWKRAVPSLLLVGLLILSAVALPSGVVTGAFPSTGQDPITFAYETGVTDDGTQYYTSDFEDGDPSGWQNNEFTTYLDGEMVFDGDGQSPYGDNVYHNHSVTGGDGFYFETSFNFTFGSYDENIQGLHGGDNGAKMVATGNGQEFLVQRDGNSYSQGINLVSGNEYTLIIHGNESFGTEFILRSPSQSEQNWTTSQSPNGDISGYVEADDSEIYIHNYTIANASTVDIPPEKTIVESDERIELRVQKLLEPNGTYPFTVYYWANESDGTLGERQEVTTDNSTTIDIENVTVNNTQVLTLNSSGDQFDTVNNSTVAETVNITATHTTENETLNTTKEVVVAEGTVRNLAILPGGMTRASAVTTDDTILALMVAGLLSVAGSRFVNSFAGLSIAEMVIVVGWLGGYVNLGIAMLSIFVAMFIGLNLAANIDMVSGRGMN